MTTRRHIPDAALLERVLGRAVETVQVWAVDRATGEPVYLPPGGADALRETARANLRCPYPGCDAVISTRGKSKRDHFFHPYGTPHATGGESENHLAAKTLIRAWAAKRLPPGASVREEHSIKDPATAVHRIADVMVTWPLATGMTAFEVEYKQFAVDDWRTKQNDYDRKNINCVWLIGHTRVRRYRPNDDTGEWANVVRVPALAHGWVPGGHVLIIDPATRTIGTLAADRDFTRRVKYPDWEAWLALDSIDDCTLDPIRGLITPTMRRIEDHEAAEAAREERYLAQQRAQAQKKAAEQARHAAEAADRQANWERIEAANLAAWENSPAKAAVTARWGETLPPLLANPMKGTWGIHAHPGHWHTVLYEAHIHPAKPGDRFTITDCYRTLEKVGIKRNWDNKKAFHALISWLDALTDAGLIWCLRDDNGRIHHITVRANLDTIEGIKAAERARRAEADRQRHEQQQREAAETAAKAAAVKAARQQADDTIRETRETTWQQSPLRRQVLDAHGGMIPAAIGWNGDILNRKAVHAHHEHWHAAIYMTLIHDQPTGTPIRVADAKEAIDAHGIGHEPDFTAAVAEYLYNLKQRGILREAGPLLDGLPADYTKA